MLFICAREGHVEIFNWFSGSSNFFKARGQQNYKGHTIEHVVCLNKRTSIVNEIRPRLNTRDYYGNLPIHYTVAADDSPMVLNYFQARSCEDYFDHRNFKYESIFHIAAKYNSINALRALLRGSIFVEELLKRDFKGDTPLHTAAKSGSLDILKFFLSACTPAFLELQNDFCLTPHEALR